MIFLAIMSQKSSIYFLNPLCTTTIWMTFVAFDNERECDLFLELNSLHPSLQFIFEKECNQSLPFLDVMVKKIPVKISYLCLQKIHFRRPMHSLEFFHPPPHDALALIPCSQIFRAFCLNTINIQTLNCVPSF